MVLGAQDLVEDKDDVLALVPGSCMGTVAGGLAGNADVVDVSRASRDLQVHLRAVGGAAPGA